MMIENPITRLESPHLQRPFTQRKIGYWLRLIAYFFILLIATLPVFIYIDDQSVFVLFFMLLILIPAQVILVFRTLMQATEKTAIQRQMGMWDTLVMTGINARQIVTGKRDAIIQGMWAEWMVLAVARFGVAVGFAEFFWRGSYFLCLKNAPIAFCYEGYRWSNGYPGLLEIAAGFITILVITHLELHLISLIGIVATLLPTKNRAVNWLVAALLWLTITGGAFGGIAFLNQARNMFQCIKGMSGTVCEQFAKDLYLTGDNENQYRQVSIRDSFVSLITNFRRLTDMSIVSLSTFGDSGTLLSALIMRPFFVPDFLMLMRSFTCFVGAFLGYRLLNWLLLMIAERLAVAQGALPEYRQHKWIRFLRRQIGFA